MSNRAAKVWGTVAASAVAAGISFANPSLGVLVSVGVMAMAVIQVIWAGLWR